MSYTGWINGRTIELDEPLPFADGQAVKVSVETVAPVTRAGSPRTVLAATRQSPHLPPADVAALEAALLAAKLPTHDGLMLNDQP